MNPLNSSVFVNRSGSAGWSSSISSASSCGRGGYHVAGRQFYP